MDIEYADITDIPGNINIHPYMFETPLRQNVQESRDESDNGDKPDQRDRHLTLFLLVFMCHLKCNSFKIFLTTMHWFAENIIMCFKTTKMDYMSLNSTLNNAIFQV